MASSEFKIALGRLIIALRGDLALSQEQLAFDAGVDRTRMGEIERGEANPTIDTLDKIARVLGQTLGSLIIQAEDREGDAGRRPAPTVNPEFVDRTVELPTGLTHDQLILALNRALALLDQIGLNPEAGDIQATSTVVPFRISSPKQSPKYPISSRTRTPHIPISITQHWTRLIGIGVWK
jgi:transcriptional regulator with XRE-family HTH domain